MWPPRRIWHPSQNGLWVDLCVRGVRGYGGRLEQPTTSIASSSVSAVRFLRSLRVVDFITYLPVVGVRVPDGFPASPQVVLCTALHYIEVAHGWRTSLPSSPWRVVLGPPPYSPAFLPPRVVLCTASLMICGSRVVDFISHLPSAVVLCTPRLLPCRTVLCTIR